jgi:hypothetical protein
MSVATGKTRFRAFFIKIPRTPLRNCRRNCQKQFHRSVLQVNNWSSLFVLIQEIMVILSTAPEMLP